ncbi:hypothetical protein M3E13_13505 [Oceanobacillus kimchii]|uniref:hypothetical protein n=1 Tax=Oceanobacillus kimchii TaxID=746691 RepID=UPI0021A3B711|nr:hypothetical protein [Oceanobacillus kimchii]MCT1577308.1 hypothetical protein [Oceanobacillus kimchii]MCT2136914.1 hypothetical protein [Oceanobacillus kimchii]
MIKRILFLVFFSYIVLFIPAVVSADDKVIEDENRLSEQELEAIKKIKKDFQKTYDLGLEDFKFVHNSSFDNKSSIQSKKSLKSIVMDIANESNFFDFPPIIYLNNSNGYILEKKLNGENVLHTLELNNEKQIWEVKYKESKQGAQLEDLGLIENNN